MRIRPHDSRLMPPILNAFGRAALQNPVYVLAAATEERAERSADDIFNDLLLLLWTYLFFQCCESWRDKGVCNLASARVPYLASWFLRGQDVAARPLANGICARCGELLRGDQNQHSALSNKSSCAPIDVNDEKLLDAEGKPQTDAQPPFLLRYSPDVFAREQPDLFNYDALTNKLSYCGEGPLPWLASRRGRTKKDDPKTWLCCCDCARILHGKSYGQGVGTNQSREHVSCVFS